MNNATDAAVKLAAEHDIDLADVAGSGADGRITKGDVEAHVTSLADAENAAAVAETAAAPEPETAVAETAVRAQTPPADEVTAVVAPATDFLARAQAADNLQTLIALGSLATGEEERAAIRARAKELLEQ
jgi:pyruvate/2-oxoglutarate dehydrogenase complex dihydrolipoamide acyltransferase (E2) component